MRDAIRFVGVVMTLMMSGGVNAAQLHDQLLRPDGTLIDYTLDAPVGASMGLIVLVTGSGCRPGSVNRNIAVVRAAFPRHTALIVEKIGVVPDAVVQDGFTDCSAAFHAGHTVSQRVEDTIAVIDHLDMDGPLVLFGGSEGGLTVAVLASRVAADAAIMLSAGPGMAFEELVLNTVPPEGQIHVKAGLDAARADPEGQALFAGSSHRFWADILQYRAEDYMVQSATPFLLIQGGMDTSSPLAAARTTSDRFAAEGRCNLTYWEHPALDHGMVGPTGTSHMAEVIRQAAAWALSVSPDC